MSSYGFTDGQEITGWLGVPFEVGTGRVIGAGSYVAGPFACTNFASIIVAVKAIGGNVTVKVTQSVANGPASLQLAESVVVAAGGVLFEAFVLFGDSVTIEFDGAVGGTAIDYAIYPSNTTTNAQVITQATINVQHNDLLVAAEPTLDFEDATGFAWTIADDGPNTRVKITPPVPAIVPICRVTLGAPQASFDTQTILGGNIPQTFKQLRVTLNARTTNAVLTDLVDARFNADAGANYDSQELRGNAAAASAGESFAQTAAFIARVPGASAPAAVSGGGEVLIPDYAGAAFNKWLSALYSMKNGVASGNMQSGTWAAFWRNSAPVTRLQVFVNGGGNFDTGSTFALVGLNY